MRLTFLEMAGIAETHENIDGRSFVPVLKNPETEGHRKLFWHFPQTNALVDDWAGLANYHPAAALGMVICLLSFGGMPPTAGFFGKFYVFKSAMDVYDGQLLWLVLVGVVNSAISIYYYLRIVTAMYFREATAPFTVTRSAGLVFVIALMPIIVLEMGLLPGWWMRLVG